MMLMKTMVKTRSNAERKEAEVGDVAFPCFRCGVCCSGYQVQMTLPEARELAGNLGVDWQSFTDNYLDPRWPGRDTVVLRHDSFRCVFLEQPPDSVFGLCRIHRFKPVSCLAWTAGIDRKECRQGLSRFWNLSIGENGKLKGSPADIKCFRTFVRSITMEDA